MQGWVIAGEEFPGELVSFLKADEQHWKSVKVRTRRESAAPLVLSMCTVSMCMFTLQKAVACDS